MAISPGRERVSLWPPWSHAPPTPRTGCPRRWQVPSQEEVRGRPSGALLTVRNHLTSGSLS